MSVNAGSGLISQRMNGWNSIPLTEAKSLLILVLFSSAEDRAGSQMTFRLSDTVVLTNSIQLITCKNK